MKTIDNVEMFMAVSTIKAHINEVLTRGTPEQKTAILKLLEEIVDNNK